MCFLRHATNRYQTALQAIEAAQAAGIHAETLWLPHRLMAELF
ncbi:hypothetical protein [Limnohabitans planktonicus]|jgi:hypothetical protein|nr:hypothetical protein [Limnohabitans planktonicus]